MGLLAADSPHSPASKGAVRGIALDTMMLSCAVACAGSSTQNRPEEEDRSYRHHGFQAGVDEIAPARTAQPSRRRQVLRELFHRHQTGLPFPCTGRMHTEFVHNGRTGWRGF